tara:strand:+ start:1999 stop:3474 length:1476 start_codon:yes stop_codon:yes gene_type:complete
MNVAIIVRNEQKGLYSSIGKLIAERWHVRFIVDNRDAATVIRRICGSPCPEILEEPDYRTLPTPRPNSTSTALLNEKTFGMTYSEILSRDRALGRGYYPNIDGYPKIYRSEWSKTQKFEVIHRKFEFFTNALTGADYVISQFPETIPNLICDHFSIGHFHLLQARLGSLMLWSDSSAFYSKRYQESLQGCLNDAPSTTPLENSNPTINFKPDSGGTQRLASMLEFWQLPNLLLFILYQLIRRSLLKLLGRGKKNSYRSFDWLFTVIRGYRDYRYLGKISTRLKEMRGERFVFFPLHMEPELMLLDYSNYFNNVFEAVVYISKALPADTTLVIKEQPKVLGHRSRKFYELLNMLPNVVFCALDESSLDWIADAELVITIAGTAGEEAVRMGVPVVTFGQNQVINELPTVFFVDSHSTCKKAITRILDGNLRSDELVRAREALNAATKQVSFPFPDYVSLFTADYPCLEHARNSIRELVKAYPELSHLENVLD